MAGSSIKYYRRYNELLNVIRDVHPDVVTADELKTQLQTLQDNGHKWDDPDLVVKDFLTPEDIRRYNSFRDHLFDTYTNPFVIGVEKRFSYDHLMVIYNSGADPCDSSYDELVAEAIYYVPEFAIFLLQKYQDITPTEKQLEYAVVRDHVKIATTLLRRGADANYYTSSHEQPLVFLAVSFKMMKLLCKHGADLKRLDITGSTILTSFCRKWVRQCYDNDELRSIIEFLLKENIGTSHAGGIIYDLLPNTRHFDNESLNVTKLVDFLRSNGLHADEQMTEYITNSTLSMKFFLTYFDFTPPNIHRRSLERWVPGNELLLLNDYRGKDVRTLDWDGNDNTGEYKSELSLKYSRFAVQLATLSKQISKLPLHSDAAAKVVVLTIGRFGESRIFDFVRPNIRPNTLPARQVAAEAMAKKYIERYRSTDPTTLWGTREEVREVVDNMVKKAKLN
jgi:hypothetical protein